MDGFEEKDLEKEFQDWLIEAVYAHDEEGEVLSVVTYDEGMVLTRNRGFTVRRTDGTVFQVTVVEDRR